MTIDLVYEILSLVLSLIPSQKNATAQDAATVANTLVQIVQKGAQAYAQQMGKALDPSLLTVESPV